MWKSHFNELSTTSPKNFTESTTSIVVLLSTKVCIVLLYDKTLVFDRLSHRRLESHQDLMVRKSLDIVSYSSATSGPLQVKLVSSAKRQILPLMSRFAMSLINTRNKIGPSTEPWGTPHSIGLQEDIDVPILTSCLLLPRYDLSHSSGTPLNP